MPMSTTHNPLNQTKWGRNLFIRVKQPNARTDRRGRPGASELETDAARPRSVQ